MRFLLCLGGKGACVFIRCPPAAVPVVHRGENNIVLTKLHKVFYTLNVLPICHWEQIAVCRLESAYLRTILNIPGGNYLLNQHRFVCWEEVYQGVFDLQRGGRTRKRHAHFQLACSRSEVLVLVV